jgi:UDP-N-acetylmuramyl tripeptide synthase
MTLVLRKKDVMEVSKHLAKVRLSFVGLVVGGHCGNALTTHQSVYYYSFKKAELFKDSKLSEVHQTASHFEELKSSELQ